MQNVVVTSQFLKTLKRAAALQMYSILYLALSCRASNQKTKEKKNHMCGIRLPATTDALLGFLYVCGTR